MAADRVGIALVGAGFLARTRARCYAKAAGVQVEIAAVTAASRASAEAFATAHAVTRIADDYQDLLQDPSVDAVDLCVPNHLHAPMCVAAAAAGKHVICTKPLTAYVGQDLPADAAEDAAGAQPRGAMLASVHQECEQMVAACAAAGVQLMYGENWIYAPAVQRAQGLLAKAGGSLLEMRGWESHSGSHSAYARRWKYTGGGALLRLGAHPVGAMLYLKDCEGRARNGQPILPVAVSAEVADLSRNPALDEGDRFLAGGWHDVENWGTVVITFADGSRGVANGSDNMLGGMESKLELLGSRAHLKCNLSPNDQLQAYAPVTGTFGDGYIMEKVHGDAGWTTPIPDEDWSSGQSAMCQDFALALAQGRPALSSGELGAQVTRLIYAAYLAAEQGRRVQLD